MISNTAVAPSAQPPQKTVKGVRRRNWWLRSGVLVLLSVVALAAVARWGQYRYSHLISHDAVVKGTIAQVGSRLDGRVAQVMVEENQRVKKGDVLARMEDSQIKARLSRWQAELERVRKQHTLEQLSIEAERARLNALVEQAQCSILGTQGEAAVANNEKERLERLTARYEQLDLPMVVTLTERDTNSTLLANAKAQCEVLAARKSAAQSGLKAAQFAVDALKVREAGLEVLTQQIAVAEGDVAATNAELESTVIRAPDDGWVSRRIIEAGGSVRVGDPILALWVGERVWIEAWVGETNLADLQVGSEVDVKLTAYSGQPITGRVQAIGVLSEGALSGPRLAGSRDPIFGDSPKFSVRISIPDCDLRVMPGLSAVVGIGSHSEPTVIGQSSGAADKVAALRDAEATNDPKSVIAKR